MRSGLHGGGGGGGHRRRRGCWRRLILLLLPLGRLLLLPLLPLPVLHLENFQLESPLSRRGGGSAGSRSHGGAGSALGVVVTEQARECAARRSDDVALATFAAAGFRMGP